MGKVRDISCPVHTTSTIKLNQRNIKEVFNILEFEINGSDMDLARRAIMDVAKTHDPSSTFEMFFLLLFIKISKLILEGGRSDLKTWFSGLEDLKSEVIINHGFQILRMSDIRCPLKGKR